MPAQRSGQQRIVGKAHCTDVRAGFGGCGWPSEKQRGQRGGFPFVEQQPIIRGERNRGVQPRVAAIGTNLDSEAPKSCDLLESGKDRVGDRVRQDTDNAHI